MLTVQNTAWDFDPLPETAIVPLACIEPHGPHLPVGTDILLVSAIAEAVALRISSSTFLLPAWPLGNSALKELQIGMIPLGYETLWAVVRDIVTSLNQKGIRQVVILNNHGSAMQGVSAPVGNAIVKTAVRQLNYDTSGLSAIWVQPFFVARAALNALFESAGRELHAGAVETSLMLHLSPERVGQPPAEFYPEQDLSGLNAVTVEQFPPAGVWGDPQEASAEKGARAFEAVVGATVSYIEDTFAQLRKLKGTAS
jgi:creatinine amidohydrolase